MKAGARTIASVALLTSLAFTTPAVAKGTVADPATKDFKRVVAAAYAKYKDLKDGKMSKKDQEELAQQFKELQEKMQKLRDKNEALQQLKKDFAEGKIDRDCGRSCSRLDGPTV